MTDPLQKTDRPDTTGANAERPTDEYEPPQLRKYGSLAELTRSGTGTVMENGKGPPQRRTP